MARQRPSVERLRRFAEEHLLYEAGMLYEVTVKLMNRHHKDDLIAENALLESFGIHSRNLIDFLWLDKPKGPGRQGDGPPQLQPTRCFRGREGLASARDRP